MSRTGSGIMEHGKPHRLMAVWTAAHDNGWVTSVVENPDGSFAAWAAPDGESAGVYTIQPDVDSGQAAAEAALQRHTGHDGCSDGCSLWEVRTYAVFDRRRKTESRADGARGGSGAADGVEARRGCLIYARQPLPKSIYRRARSSGEKSFSRKNLLISCPSC